MSATPRNMPNVVEHSAPQPAPAAPPQPAQPLRLTLSPGAAAKQIAGWLSRGLALRKHRLRDLTDLDKARLEKKTWIASYTELLMKLFDGPAVAEACNDWVGRLLPEYAPLGLVIEQFYEEMDHRLRRLQAVVDHLEDMADESSPTAPEAAAAGPAAAGSTPKKDETRSKSLNWARLFPTAEELAGVEATAAPGGATTASIAATQAAKPGEVKTHAAPGTLPPVVKPVGLLLVHTAEDTRPICEFLADLAVTPRVVLLADAKPHDPEALVAGATSPAFALVWPGGDGEPATKFQFQIGFLVGRLGMTRVCLMQVVGKSQEPSPVPSITIDAHGGWQLPLARTLKRAGVAVDLNRLC